MENEVKNFYDEEAKYEKSVEDTKEIVEKVVKIDTELLAKKINHVDENKDFEDFIDLLVAVTGKKTNSYYYCQNNDDVKYHGLEIGKVYKTSDMNPEIQSRVTKKEVLNLQARVILAPILLEMTKNLKVLFGNNYQKGDGLLSTIDDDIIIRKDLDYLGTLVNYLEILSDNTGRLKILVAERDVYALERAKEEYSKKTSLEKWFNKTFKRENDIIEGMAKKR